MPDALLKAWTELAHYGSPPEACLINFYGPAAKMGLHQDRDEAVFDAPVLSLSLGDSCVFRIGGSKRNDPTRSFRLSSGDVLVATAGWHFIASIASNQAHRPCYPKADGSI
jgi:alkylated DNA repair protein (DNA oxidative demethylase)